jgi:oligoendopeptidase F
MKTLLAQFALILILAALFQAPAPAQTRDRADVPPADTWNLADIYPGDDAWTAARDALAARFDEILPFQGTLADSPARLLACLKLDGDIDKELTRLFCYAAMKSDQDTRVSKYQGMKQTLQQLATDYGSKSSFIAPEITAMDEAAVEDFIRREPGLEVYRMFLEDILRTKTHRLSAPEEKLLAETGLMASAPQSIFTIFSNAEMPFPELTLSDGASTRLNQAGYARFRSSPVREDRRAVFDAFFGTYKKFEQTFGAGLSAQINKDMFYAKARNYGSSLERALDADNIPVEVYHSLVDNVNRNLGSFHRYLKLKKRMLGVEQLEYSDVYAPVVEDVKLDFTYDEAKAMVLKAVAPLGDDYVAVAARALDERWIDVYPTEGKRSGAYSNGGCYDVHPYILLNYNGQYDDVSTLAHELGHTMHSYYSNKTQPYATADYATFVAEVASTLNEALLIDQVLETIDDDDVRLSLLMNYLDGIKGTVFRQTQFAEFELAIHETAEKGEPLTGDALTRIYGDILRRYYVDSEGTCRIADRDCVEWAYVPHFYLDFYVYQYATSFTASTALSEEILSGEKGAVGRAIKFLSAGGSDYPVSILKQAGVDMTTSQPFDKTMVVMNDVMDRIEAILDRKK